MKYKYLELVLLCLVIASHCGCDSSSRQVPNNGGTAVSPPTPQPQTPPVPTPPAFRKELFSNSLRVAAAVRTQDESSIEALLTEVKTLDLQNPSPAEKKVIEMLSQYGLSMNGLRTLGRLKKISEDLDEATALLKKDFSYAPIGSLHDEKKQMERKGLILVGSRYEKVLPFPDQHRDILRNMNIEVVEGEKGGLYIDHDAEVLARKGLSDAYLKQAADLINRNGVAGP